MEKTYAICNKSLWAADLDWAAQKMDSDKKHNFQADTSYFQD
ncbi:MAG: hypothetical protein ACUVT2_05525 [Thiobacillaceae bacterium]